MFELKTENGEKKQQLAIGIYKIVKSIVKLSVFRRKQSLFSEKLHFISQHTSCVNYYDDIINRDVPKLDSKDVLTNKKQL